MTRRKEERMETFTGGRLKERVEGRERAVRSVSSRGPASKQVAGLG